MYSLKERLTELLINKGILTQVQLQKAIEIQKQKGSSLKNILIEQGFINEKDLIIILSQGLGIPPITLSRFKIDASLMKIITRDIAKKYQIIPVSKVGNMLTVAMADPLNVFAIDDLRMVTGLEIGSIITSQKEIEEAIEQYYGVYTQEAMEELMEDIKTQDLEIIKTGSIEEAVDTSQIYKLVEEAPVVKVTNMLLENAITSHSSDVLIEPMNGSVRIRYRIDGILKEAESIPKKMHEAIVSRIKVMSELNIAESRLPQDGRFKLKTNNNEVDFRVSILPSINGEKVALRVLDKSQAMLDMEKLGFGKDNLDKFRKCCHRPHGMMLVCGPTGSGKTTTLYSFLSYVHKPEINLITVEDPIEYQLKGVNQVAVRQDVGLTFANALRSILRQDPDVIMIGEIRDFVTVDIAIKSALTGHLVFSTLHTTTASGSIIRLINMGCEPFLISASLISIVSQRLIRKLCNKCREPYKPSDALLERLKIGRKNFQEEYFYKPKGCRECFNTGYSGRTAICEILMMTPAMKDAVLKHNREIEIKQLGRREGMKTLREDGVLKVIAGVTSLEEVLRVTPNDE
jgi:type IV pilus assembly protein PilB